MSYIRAIGYPRRVYTILTPTLVRRDLTLHSGNIQLPPRDGHSIHRSEKRPRKQSLRTVLGRNALELV